MNKTDLILSMVPALGQRKDAEQALNYLLRAIRTALRSGDKVVLSGIGSFYPKIRRSSKRHNPKTMEPVLVPPKRTVKFIPSEELFVDDPAISSPARGK